MEMSASLVLCSGYKEKNAWGARHERSDTEKDCGEEVFQECAVKSGYTYKYYRQLSDITLGRREMRRPLFMVP